MTMDRQKFLRVAGVVAAVCLGAGLGARAQAQDGNAKAGNGNALTPCVLNGKKYENCTRGMVKQSKRQELAKTLKAKRKAAKDAGIPLPQYTTGMGPDFFGVDPNYANSPMPMGDIDSLVVVFGGAGYSAPAVTITDAYNPLLTGSATATLDPGGSGAITGFTSISAPSGYMAPVVTITDATGANAVARATLKNIVAGTGMRKFVPADTLPVPPIATSSDCTYSGQAAECYEIWLVEYTQTMHSDLPPTKLRGYVQVPIGWTGPPPTPTNQYLGPIIVAHSSPPGKPVRITFKNKLPTGAGGNLFIPVDTTYMGAGIGPDGVNSYTQNRAAVHLHGGTTPWISDGTPHQWTTPACTSCPENAYPNGVSVYNVPDMQNPGKNAVPGEMTFYYTNQQSARLMFYHDHSFGITRLNVYVGEAAGYLLTDSTEEALVNGTPITNPNTGQSYTVTGGIPGTLGVDEFPLIIQDKTFVPSLAQLNAQDPSWKDLGMPTPLPSDLNGNGALWWPHVYMTNQNPYDISGANAMGRWDYGPWFWPPFTGIMHGPVPNPYCHPTPGVDCSQSPGEPPFKPGMPDLSGTPESFMDTMLVNGKAYPTLTVPAGKVRFRILSVGNDRMLNLSLFVAAAKDGSTTAETTPATPPTLCTDNSTVAPDRCTEVAMVPFNSAQDKVTPFPAWWYTIIPGGFTFDDRAGGVPDPRTRGPAWIQIGTEGGFLPAPALIKNQPVSYVYNRRDITVGNVLQKALFLGPAERADVIVDFTKFAGKTLILYNDAPAPVPAADPRLDYYTGNPDNTDTGGAPSTQAGYGPNTRTIMQIQVQGTSSGAAIAVDDYDSTLLTALQSALPAAFAASQDPIIVPQQAYDAVYGTTTTDTTGVNVANIQSTALVFTPYGQATPLTLPLQPKSIIEDFTMDYGRMNALLGVEIPKTNNTNQTSIPQGFADPPTELVRISDARLVPIGTASDGSQVWKITHNGVDTHAMHFHMFNVQVVNRAGWDGAIRMPDPNEFGFKDTVRMNPLEDIVVAVRPIQLENVPFDVPNSIRLLAPTAAPGATTTPTGEPLFINIDPNGNPVTVTNQLANFGWEFVWHCHLLGHEENDMMRPLTLAVSPRAPSNLSVTQQSNSNLELSWTDNSPLMLTGFTIQRAADVNFLTGVSTFTTGNVTTFTDTTAQKNQLYYYRVFAANTIGSTVPGYPTLTANSLPSNIYASSAALPADPTGLTATLQAGPQVRLSWTDNATNETGFSVERSLNGGPFAPIASVGPRNNTGSVSYTDTTAVGANTPGNAYSYRVWAVNAAGSSLNPTNTAAVTLTLPAAPGNFAASAVVRNSTSDTVTLSWTDNANNETGFTIQRATDAAFTLGLNTQNVAANATTATQNVNRSTNYYYRIRANNLAGSSVWVNATPLPILTP